MYQNDMKEKAKKVNIIEKTEALRTVKIRQ